MDYYKTLGVNKTASQDDIKRAYRKLAMQNHPDRTGGDDTKFKEINEAYDTLKDPAKRKDYDNPQPKQQQYQYNTNNMNDMFNSFFGQRRRMIRNKDVSLTIKVELKDVLTGKDVIGRYKLANGQDEIATIRVPPGIDSNITMRYQGLGDNAIAGIPRGDLLIRVIVKNHRNWERDRLHLRTRCAINVLELILGTEVVVQRLDGGPLHVKIPPGTNPGTILSIPGYGLPDINTGKRGNIYLEVKGITPKIEDKEILEKVKNLHDGIS